ncbi:S-adenosyl-L-methionine-dependent methyltransferase [Mollisia scopiformis]|uniref:S-adenosyl-L-methionine-dependent methyltransferase n=1 Tax=Mollisia scopiformis TaxID=149040 RepID=A0A194XV74_MOLSC|nr:S-adenosyl-L-methionine-dependent methyltransferase [Mollisia scopiformis]KUJ23612.1 S-adenosyl-L-methionine-dependent methyltransferase [Mollisia scopiformis]
MATNTEKNRSHWDEAASTYNTKYSKTINQIIKEIQTRKDWIGVDWAEDVSDDENTSSSVPKKTVRLLDYACGTGLVSRALAPYVTQCIGIDLTEGMVNEYNTSAQNQGIPATEIHAYQGNLIDPSQPTPAALSGKEFFDFDIAVVGLGFHHFDQPALAAKRLAERLKQGGVLMIVEFMPHEHFHGHNAAKTVTHMGFSEEEVKKMFEEAGCGGDFRYLEVGKGKIAFGEGQDKVERSVFFARGSKL